MASIVTLLLLVASCALAQSQRQQPERGARGTQQPTAPDPRGTDASPLIVKVQPTPKTDEEAAEKQRNVQQEGSDRSSTRSLAIVTALLALFQLGAIGFQVRIAAKQNQIIEKQNTIMTGQRDAADTQSTYMSDGLIETRKAADAAKQSANSAETTLAIAHRPRLVIRHIVVDGIDHGELGEKLTNGYAWVTNIGVFSATLFRVHAEWLLERRLPLENPALTAIDTDTVPVTISPAAFTKIPIPDRTIGIDEHIEIWTKIRARTAKRHTPRSMDAAPFSRFH